MIFALKFRHSNETKGKRVENGSSHTTTHTITPTNRHSFTRTHTTMSLVQFNTRQSVEQAQRRTEPSTVCMSTVNGRWSMVDGMVNGAWSFTNKGRGAAARCAWAAHKRTIIQSLTTERRRKRTLIIAYIEEETREVAVADLYLVLVTQRNGATRCTHQTTNMSTSTQQKHPNRCRLSFR